MQCLQITLSCLSMFGLKKRKHAAPEVVKATSQPQMVQRQAAGMRLKAHRAQDKPATMAVKYAKQGCLLALTHACLCNMSILHRPPPALLQAEKTV